MKTLLPFTIFLFCTTLISAQIYERTDDRGFHTNVERVHALSVGSWITLITHQNFAFSNVPGSALQFFDASGHLQWEYETSFTSTSSIKEVLLTAENNIAIFEAESACDVAVGTPISIAILDVGGNVLIETSAELVIDPFEVAISGCSTAERLFITSWSDLFSSGTQVVGMNNSGADQWSLSLNYEQVHGVAALGDDAVVFGEEELMRIDGNGVKVDSLAYAQPPTDVASAANQIYMAMPEGVYALDENLMLNPVIPAYTEPGPPFQILSEAGEIHLVYGDAIHVYNTSYDLVESIALNALPDFQIEDGDMNEDAYALVGNRPFTTTIRYMGGTEDFATSSGSMQLVPLADEVPDQFPDAALRHLEITNYNPSVHQADANFYLVNEGNLTLDSVQVNFMGNVNPIACGTTGATEGFYNLSLAPGDSVLLTMEGLAYGYPFNDLPEDSAGVEYCVYVTEPNNLYDRVEANDQVCGNGTTVGINEKKQVISSIYPNPASGQLSILLPSLNGPAQIQVLDATGTLIFEEQVSRRTNLEFSVSDWSAGLYLARIVAAGKASAPVKFSVVK